MRALCRSGWSSKVVVEAFVVNVKGAANPDKDGLIQARHCGRQWCRAVCRCH